MYVVLFYKSRILLKRMNTTGPIIGNMQRRFQDPPNHHGQFQDSRKGFFEGVEYLHFFACLLGVILFGYGAIISRYETYLLGVYIVGVGFCGFCVVLFGLSIPPARVLLSEDELVYYKWYRLKKRIAFRKGMIVDLVEPYDPSDPERSTFEGYVFRDENRRKVLILMVTLGWKEAALLSMFDTVVGAIEKHGMTVDKFLREALDKQREGKRLQEKELDQAEEKEPTSVEEKDGSVERKDRITKAYAEKDVNEVIIWQEFFKVLKFGVVAVLLTNLFWMSFIIVPFLFPQYVTFKGIGTYVLVYIILVSVVYVLKYITRAEVRLTLDELVYTRANKVRERIEFDGSMHLDLPAEHDPDTRDRFFRGYILRDDKGRVLFELTIESGWDGEDLLGLLGVLMKAIDKHGIQTGEHLRRYLENQ